jgi:hypothetical protein
MKPKRKRHLRRMRCEVPNLGEVAEALGQVLRRMVVTVRLGVASD